MANKMTMQQIADRLGVSKYTVSRALSGKDGVGEATRREVMAMAAAFGYRVTSGAGERDHAELAVYVGMDERHALEPMFWRRVMDGIGAGCRENGLSVPHYFSYGETDGGSLSSLIEDMAKAGASGVIAAGKCPSALLLKLQTLGLPMVLLDHEEPVLPADCVLNANVEAGRMACHRLLSEGCRSIAFVGRDSFSVSFRERFWGCRLALDDRREAWLRAAGGIDAGTAATVRPAPKGDAQLRKWTVPYGKGPLPPAVEKKLGAACSEDAMPDGFVCANDDIALIVLERLLRLGIAVPQRCRVSGIDNTAAGLRAPIPLTTVDLAKERLGMRAVEALIRRHRKSEGLPEKVVLSARLIVRQSG